MNYSESLRREKGAVAIIVALMMVALVGFTAFVVDIGALYERRREVQTAVDGAALAGAQELPERDPAIAKAKEYLVRNTVVDADLAEIIFPNDLTIKVTAPEQTVNFSLAPVLGINSSTVSATATAIKEYHERFVPWAVVMTSLTPEQLAGSQEVVLKMSAGGQTTGNFQSLVIPRSDTTGSGPTYEENIALGTENVLVVGQFYDTYPGNRPSELTQGLIIGSPPDYVGLLAQGSDEPRGRYDPPGSTPVQIDICKFEEVFGFTSGTEGNVVSNINDILRPKCPRLVRVPVITEWPAGSKPVQIIEFLWFFIKEPPPPSSGQIFEVKGLIFQLPQSAWPYSIRLIE